MSSLLYQKCALKAHRPTPHAFHSSLLHLPFMSKQWCFLFHRTAHLTPVSEERHPTQFVHSHNKSYRLCYSAASPASERGKVWHRIWTCMNESDGIKAPSQQATHSASSASVCLACVALSCILQWASLCRAGARHPPLQTPVLDILDSPSCDIFLVWTRWCHFLPG